MDIRGWWCKWQLLVANSCSLTRNLSVTESLIDKWSTKEYWIKLVVNQIEKNQISIDSPWLVC